MARPKGSTPEAMMGVVRLAVSALTLNNESNWSYFFPTLVLVATLTAAALIIVWLGRWMRKPSGSLSSGNELTRFRLLYERGELEREEYERIKAKLAPRIRQELKLPAKPTESPPPAAPDARTEAPPRPDLPPAPGEPTP